jgi:hypothetical protein
MVRLLYQDEIETYFDSAMIMEGRQVRYKDRFASLIDRVNRSIGKEDSSTKEELQYYKDETIITLYTFVSIDKIYHTPAGKNVWKDIFSKAFQERETINEFEALLKHGSKMVLETPLPPTEEMKSKIVQWVQSNPHPVKYVRDRFQTSRIEDPTMADVTLTFQNEAPKTSEPRAVVCFECKFMSDISHETTHHYARNQIARIIDVGWSLYGDGFYFVLVTPGIFKNGKTRFYSYKMRDYQGADLEVLKQDLLISPDLQDEDLQLISHKIGWISWEDLIQTIFRFRQSNSEVPFKELADFFAERRLLQLDYFLVTHCSF